MDGSEAAVIDRRSVSVQWFSGTILTGLCGAALIGGAVFASLDGEMTFAKVPEHVETALRGAFGGADKGAVARKSAVCAAISGHWNDLTGLGRSVPELVREYARQKEASYRQRCRTDHPGLNCEKVAVLSAVSLPTLQAMDAAHLKFYETAWSEANLSL